MDNPLSLLNFAVLITILVFGISRPISERSILRSDQVKNLSAEARLVACRSLIVKWTVLLGVIRSNDSWSACSRVIRIVGRAGVGVAELVGLAVVLAAAELVVAAVVVAAPASAGLVWMVRWLA